MNIIGHIPNHQHFMPPGLDNPGCVLIQALFQFRIDKRLPVFNGKNGLDVNL